MKSATSVLSHRDAPGKSGPDPNDVPLTPADAWGDPDHPDPALSHLPVDLAMLVGYARLGSRSAALAAIRWLAALVADPDASEPRHEADDYREVLAPPRPDDHPDLAGLLRAARHGNADAVPLITDYLLERPGEIEPPRRAGRYAPGQYQGTWAGWHVIYGNVKEGSAAAAALEYSRARRRTWGVIFVPEFDFRGAEAGHRKVRLLDPAAADPTDASGWGVRA